ncbi:hypothetical protein VO54_00023 [Elizabethkingia miricola]|nr:hypothetical protein VO54_00023 [Elizabethkingia miricola]
MMKNRDEKQTKRSVMKEYIPPAFEVQYIEMEEGIATGSDPTTPPTTGGLVSDVQTDWAGQESDTNVTVGF